MRRGIQRSAESIRQDMEAFEQSEGWDKLSEAQQSLIHASLIVTERGERGTEEEALINNDPFLQVLFTLSNKIRVARSVISQQIRRIHKHATSKKHIDDYYCNISVFVVENIEWLREESKRLEAAGAAPLNIPKNLPPEELRPGPDFFDGDKIESKDPSEIEKAFADGGFPYVCHIQFDKANLGKRLSGSSHSFIVFKHPSLGLILWEKVARRERHKRSNLKTVLETYKPDKYSYYIRPMKRSAEKKNV